MLKTTLRPVLLGALSMLAIMVAPCPASAQARLGVDVSQGVYLPKSYAFNGVVVPGFDIGRLRLAGELGATLENPRWALIAGFQPSVVVGPLLSQSAGLRLVGDISYVSQGAFMPQRTSWRLTGGVAFDLEGIRVGVSGGYDWLRDAALVLTTIGFDIPSVVSFLAGNPFASKPDACGCGR